MLARPAMVLLLASGLLAIAYAEGTQSTNHNSGGEQWPERLALSAPLAVQGLQPAEATARQTLLRQASAPK